MIVVKPTSRSSSATSFTVVNNEMLVGTSVVAKTWVGIRDHPAIGMIAHLGTVHVHSRILGSSALALGGRTDGYKELR